MVLSLVLLQFAAYTNPPRGELGFPAPQALRQFLCFGLASLPVNITVGGYWNIMVLFPVHEGSRTKELFVEMRLVDVRELRAMQREHPVFVKELCLSVWWFGSSKTSLKKLLCLSIDVVILTSPPIHRQTLFVLMFLYQCRGRPFSF